MVPNVVIIQGTGSGIGLHLARQYLARSSLEVVALSRGAARAKEAILSAAEKGWEAKLDTERLHTLSIDGSEESYAKVANELESRFGDLCLKALWNVNGILRIEKNLAQISMADVEESFKVNVFSHLLAYKHFVRFIPRGVQAREAQASSTEDPASAILPAHLSVVASISARVGSITDNKKGGWYSYRASKAALNQLIKTLSKEFELRSVPAIAVGLHPGTVRTQLSKNFTGGPDSNQPLENGQFEAHQAAENLVNVVSKLTQNDNGSFRDYKNESIPW